VSRRAFLSVCCALKPIKFGEHQSHLSRHSDQIAELYQLIEALQKDNIDIKTTFAKSPPSPASTSSDPRWLVKPDSTIIRVHSDDMITVQSCLNCLGPWLSKLGLRFQTHFQVTGDWDQPSFDFVVQFLGDAAERNCDNALRKQRKPDKTWENFFAATPAETWTQLYLGPDKNNHQITKEVATRRMGAVIEAFQGVDPQALTIARREGCVLLSWEPICLIDPAPGGVFTIKWSEQVLVKHGICKLVATREFGRLTAESAGARRNVGALVASTQWCS